MQLFSSVCTCSVKTVKSSHMYLATYSQGEEHFTVPHLLDVEEEFSLAFDER